MASNKILKLFIFVLFLNFATTKAQDDPFYLKQDCSSDKTDDNTSFQIDVKNLLLSLLSNATTGTKFYNATINPTDSIYGLFMCRGDVSSKLCQKCVENATQKLSSECSVSKQATIWYEECMVRYSNNPFFSKKSTEPSFAMQNSGNVSNANFTRLLSMMNQTSNEAASSAHFEKKFATRETNFSGFETVYCLAQCTPDLSPNDCRTCLSELIEEIPNCCEGRIGGRVLNPSCNIRYEFYPFYNIPSLIPTPNLVPATEASQKDTEFSDDVYLDHNCSINKPFISNSTFQTHLNTLLSYLSSNATSGKKLFHKVDINEMVYGLFMCRGDLSSEICGKCVPKVAHRISSECEMSKEGIIWYNHCMVRYSYNNFFSKEDDKMVFSKLNVTNNEKELNFFTVILAKTLDKAAILAGDSDKKFGTKSAKLNEVQSVYTLAQCTQDLPNNDCKGCLGEIIGTAIPWPRLGSIGGRVMYPSCNLRFEVYQFYNGSRTTSGSPQSPSENGKSRIRLIILIVVSTFVSVMIFSLGYYMLKRKARKSSKTMLIENFGHDGVNLEALQFDLAVIQAATNKFSNENYIGKGGFGEVYKGIFLDGQQIAVKRLSKSSNQGASEFKNEVLLIAKLQHRNLVAFIGFCLEEQEKMLIYEYVSNKSLDYLLFDSKRQKLLSWIERYSIIRGIAQGILYLHEHSRLKVIHRDLKPSNILLDENMVPKISDFGLARIFEKNQDQGSTNKIVGTLGYMSPEYAMLGQFSQKSDVFSFGIMVLEIITGRKNVNSYGSQGIGDSLPNHVWRHLRTGTQFNILDPNIQGNFSKIEVIRCIQIGLLCVQQNPEDRPTIVTIVSYLDDNNLNEIPTPQEPTFFLHGDMDPIAIVEETSSRQSMSTSMPFSMNEMPTSEYLPR